MQKVLVLGSMRAGSSIEEVLIPNTHSVLHSIWPMILNHGFFKDYLLTKHRIL